MHDAAYQAVGRMARESGIYDRLNADFPILGVDLGGADHNGTARAWFPDASWTAVDLRPYRGVHVVADAATWRPPQPVHIVLCTELLEHAQNWRGIVQNAIRMLAPGGAAFFTCGGDGRGEHSHNGQPLPPGEYYGNVSADEMRKVLRALPGLDPVTWRVTYAPVVCDLYAWVSKPGDPYARVRKFG